MDWVWSAVTEFWRMVWLKTKAKVVGGRVWKFKGFCYEDIAVSNFQLRFTPLSRGNF